MTINGKEYKVRDLMRPVVAVYEKAQLKEVLEALVKGKSNIAAVVDEEGVFVGAVSTLDIIRAILPDYLEADTVAAHFADTAMLFEDTQKAANKPVTDFVERNEVTVDPETDLLEATVLSSVDGNARIFVLGEDRKPLGLLTRTEIKQVLATFLNISDDLQESLKKTDC